MPANELWKCVLSILLLAGVLPNGTLAATQIRTVSSDAQGIVLEFDAQGFSLEQVREQEITYCKVDLPGAGRSSKEGYPLLPLQGFLIGLPEEAEPSVQVLETDYNDRPDTLVSPCPRRLLREEDGRQWFVYEPFRQEEAYGSEGYYPGVSGGTPRWGILERVTGGQGHHSSCPGRSRRKTVAPLHTDPVSPGIRSAPGFTGGAAALRPGTRKLLEDAGRAHRELRGSQGCPRERHPGRVGTSAGQPFGSSIPGHVRPKREARGGEDGNLPRGIRRPGRRGVWRRKRRSEECTRGKPGHGDPDLPLWRGGRGF